MKRNAIIGVFVVLFVFGIGIWLGRVTYPMKLTAVTQLRASGAHYTSPLLLCDIQDELVDARYNSLKKALEAAIAQAKNNGIESASVYFRDLSAGTSFTINPQEKYIPASLNKVPMMMTALDYEQRHGSFLQSTFVYNPPNDANADQLVSPPKTLVPGETYSLEDALYYLIVYSDNGAYNVLTNYLKMDDYLNMFALLKIPQTDAEGLTAAQYSYFLRVLYNSTLLNRPFSEKALGLLAESQYDQGLVAGVPTEVEVAHKFGVHGTYSLNTKEVLDRQIHDCGIVYAGNKPYLLCVMTKSKSELTVVEQFIADVSRQMYNGVMDVK